MQPPLIDVEGFGNTGWHAGLDAACREWGCFQIVGHGVPQDVLDALLQASDEFFSLPHAEKLAIERTGQNAWGYYDQELTKNVRDWKEIFDVGPPEEHGPMRGSTPQWPTRPNGFKAAVEAYSEAAERVASELLAGVSVCLGMPPSHLASDFAGAHSSFLRLNHYPLCDAPDANLGISPHTDAGAVTVLLMDAQPGLQFEHRGEWVTVKPIAGALTVNIGDIVQVWSNDRYAAPLHRVLANAHAERYSAAFFYNPSYDCRYAPLPGIVSAASPARYHGINWGEFRAARAAGDYADYGEEIQISQFRI